MENEEKKTKVLVVDDEEVIRESLRGWFDMYGFDVDTAENGTQALKLIQDQDFGVVILDLRLPDMGGIELLKEARKSRPELKAIVFTAYPSRDTTVEAVKLGAIEYLVKPFDPEDLVRIIKEISSGSKSEIGQDYKLIGSVYQLVSEWKKRAHEKP